MDRADPARRTSRPPAATRAGASSTATTHAGATVRDEAKYGRLIDFARALPAIRRRTDRDLRRRGLPREKVLALVVRLLEADADPRRQRGVRAGEPQLRALDDARPARRRCAGTTMRFTFRGKCGKEHEIDVRDRRLARIVDSAARSCRARSCSSTATRTGRAPVGRVRRRQRLPARDQRARTFTAKDFRTWAGTVAAAMALQRVPRDRRRGRPHERRSCGRSRGRRAARQHADRVPRLLRPPRRSSTATSTARWSMPSPGARAASGRGAHALRADEAAVLGLLQARLARERRSRRAA